MRLGAMGIPEPYGHSSGARNNEWFELRSLTESQHTVQPVTSVAFDSHEELLWTGLSNGRVVSYLNPGMEKYSSFMAHSTPIRQILVDETEVITLSESGLRIQKKGGLPRATFEGEEMHDLTCMTFSGANNSEILIGGDTASSMLVFNVQLGRIEREVELSQGLVSIRRGRMVNCAGINGEITLHDPRSYRIEHVLQAFNGGISDIDVKNDLLVACGYTKRAGQLYMDPLVKVYDLRTMRPLPPIPFPAGPFLLKFHPKFTSTLAITSQMGQLQLTDVQGEIGPIRYHQVDTNGDPLLAFDVSSTGEIIALGDAGGYVHQWADREDIKVNTFSRPTELVDIFPPPPSAHIGWEDGSLSQIQLHPNTGKKCSSDWVSDVKIIVGRPPKRLSPEFLAHLKQIDFVGYATRNTIGAPPPRKRAALPVSFANLALSSSSSSVDLTLDNTTVDTDGPTEMISSSDKSLELAMTQTLGFDRKKQLRPPKQYRRFEIKYQRLGMEDFDFSFYNKTKYTGLENGFPYSSFINSTIQALYFTTQHLRIYFSNHLCDQEFCLSCELSFLFHMLDESKGKACIVNNFIRSLRKIPSVSEEGFLTTAIYPPICPMSAFHRYLLTRLHKEYISNTTPAFKSQPQPSIRPPIINNLYGFTTRTTTLCLKCQVESQKDNVIYQVGFVYPSAKDKGGNRLSFASLLRESLSSEVKTVAWCSSCASATQAIQRKIPTTLPNILCIGGCTHENSDAMAFWKSKTAEDSKVGGAWLPFRIRLTLASDKLVIQEYSENRADDSSDIYELTTVVSHIVDPVVKQQDHFIAHINTSSNVMETGVKRSRTWYLFNDFNVIPVYKQEVVSFNANWRTPCIFYYSRVDIEEKLPKVEAINPITEEVFFMDDCLSGTSAKQPTYEKSPADLPKKGELVAIDAEFVQLAVEETETKDEEKRVVSTPIFSVARCSALYGAANATLIDDYIATPEPVADYLTRFSGIVHGDLDPLVSRHHITTLKSMYLKLRHLIDRGVVFVGHGLNKDFRIINIVVPTNQVMDTVELFRMKRQRKISLRFLASFLLNMDIQTETHCSIEDARTAMTLLRLYQKLCDDGTYEEVIRQIYQFGRMHNWQLPGALNDQKATEAAVVDLVEGAAST